MSEKFEVPKLLSSVAEQMWVAFQEKLIPHAGERGTAREEVVRQFLAKHLSQRFAVSTGFVFDRHGDTSRQVDVIIYDPSVCPKFETVGGKGFFPCESVVCVGEVRSAITSKRELNNAFENIGSVKGLDRSGGYWQLDQKTDHLDQVFGFLFVIDRCLTELSARKALFEYLAENERYLWPNVCYFFDKYLVTYECEHGGCPNPMDAFAISVMKDLPRAELLLHFFLLVARAVEVTRVTPFRYWEYFRASQGMPRLVYAFKDAPIKGKLPDHMLRRTSHE